MNDHHHLRTTISGRHGQDEDHFSEGETVTIREIHALEPPGRVPWDTSSHVSFNNSLSMTSENFTTMSREFNALVLAGSAIGNHPPTSEDHHHYLGMIGEGRDDEVPEDTNPLAIVHQQNASSHMTPLASPRRVMDVGPSGHGEVSVRRVKEEEVESKIMAWENAKVAKINNRYKREDAIISGWENAQVERASASMKKVERKLEEKLARALEKMQNDVAKARRKAEEKRASAEAKRGTKVAEVFESCNLMRVLGRDPSKRSFF